MPVALVGCVADKGSDTRCCGAAASRSGASATRPAPVAGTSGALTVTTMTYTPDTPLLAFDLETEGLDPRKHAITSASLFDEAGYAAVVEARNETRLLELVAELFYGADQVVVGWNSAVFDFPFLHARCLMNGVEPFFEMTLNPAIVPKYSPLPGYEGGYDVVVSNSRRGLSHVDIAYRYKDWATQNGVTWSLKPVAIANGIDMIEVDREHMERLSRQERMAYNLSDTVGTYALARLLACKGELAA